MEKLSNVRISRRKVVGTGTVLLVAPVIAGCAQPAVPTPTAKPGAPTPVSRPAPQPTAKPQAATPAAKPPANATAAPAPALTLKLWQAGFVGFPATLPQNPSVASLSGANAAGTDLGLLQGATFQATHPTVRIQPVLKNYWAGSGQQQLLTDLAGNTAPAIWPAIGDDPAPYVHQNLAADLTSFFTNWKPWTTVPQALRDTATVNGKVYALPADKARGYGMSYRKDLFEAAGVKAPSTDWTIDDFVAICRRVADPAKKLWAISMLTSQWPSWYFDEWAQAFGVPLSLFPIPNKDGTNFAMAPPEELARVLTFYQELVFTDKVALAGMGENYGTMMSDVVAGRAVMGVLQTVQMGQFFGHVGQKGFIQPDQIGLLSMPVGPEGLRNYDIGSNYWCIDSRLTGDALKTTWDTLAHFVAGPGEQLMQYFWNAAGSVPPSAPVYAGIVEPAGIRSRVPPQWITSSQVATGVPVPPNPGRFGISGQQFGKVKDTIDPFIQAILVDANANPLDQAKKMVDAVNSTLYSQPASGLTKDKWHAYYAALGKYFQTNYPKYYAGTYTKYYKQYESF